MIQLLRETQKNEGTQTNQKAQMNVAYIGPKSRTDRQTSDKSIT